MLAEHIAYKYITQRKKLIVGLCTAWQLVQQGSARMRRLLDVTLSGSHCA